MNILVMGMNYFPEKTAVGPLTTGICEYLGTRGHQVSMITAFPHYPEWAIHEPYRHRRFLQEERNGVKLLRGYVYIPKKGNTFERILYDCSFSISAFFLGWKVGNIDVILVICPPIQLAVCAWVLSLLKGAPFALRIQDLPVDAAVALGKLKNPAAIRLGRWLENFTFRKARRIFAVCQGIVENLRDRGVPESKLQLVPDWVDTDSIYPMSRNNLFREMHRLDRRQFLILHAGNMGAKQALENVIRAASRLQNQECFLFLFVGDGSEKKRLVDMVNGEGIPNVKFLPLQSAEVLPQMLSSADVLLLNQHSGVIDMLFPGKLLTYMAAGRPVVAAVHADSEAARCILRAECGVVVPPEDPERLAEAIQRIQSNPELISRFGRNGRAFAEKDFSKKQVVLRYDELFQELQATSH